MKIKKYLAFTYLAALLMPGLVYANDNDEIYRKLLKAEYNNRVFAYLSTQIIAKNRVGSPMGEFYQAYFQLEKLNRGRYERMKGVVRRNPRNFRQPSSSPATSASRSMNLPSVWKV